MMNRLLVRRIAIGAGVLLAVLVIAGAIFTATFDVNRYKPQIAAAVQEHTGRVLRFDGDLGLSLFPRIAVTLPTTTLSEPGRDSVFARLQSAQAAVALLPLLRKELAVDAVRIDGLQATVVRQKDGTTNIDDLLRQQKTEAVAAGKAPSSDVGSPGTSIGEVQLKNADVTFRDLQAGRTLRLSELNLKAGRFAAGARMPLDGSAAITVDDPPLAAKVSVKAEFEWSEQGGLGGVRDLALKGEGTLKQQPVTLEARADRLVASAELVDIRGLKASASIKGDGGTLELQATAPRLDIAQGKAGGEKIELSISRRGADALDAKVLIDGVRGTAAKVEATTVKIAGTSRTGQRTTRFELATGLVASVNEKTARFERATGEVVIEDPALTQKSVRLPLVASGSVDGQRETVALQFDSRGEGLNVRGKVNTTGFATPRIVFDVEADQVDLDRYFPPSPAATKAGPAVKGAAAPSGPAGAASTSSDQKVDLSALRTLNATGNLRIGRLHVKGTDVSDLKAAVNAGDGRLDVAPFSLRIHGGSIAGRVGADARSNRVAANGSLSGIQLRQVVSSIGGRAAIEGSANGTFDLATAGATTAQMKRALDGALALDVREGALVGIDLADLLGTAATFMQSRGKQTGGFDQNKRTPFSQLSATVHIKGGVAANDDLKAKSPQLDIAGSGRLDLVSTELDYLLKAQVLPGPAVERGPLRSLVGITVPVRVAGPLEKPGYAVDWGSVAAEALLKRATGTTGKPSVDQLIEGLGGLLGRRKK